jgi:Peptidase family S64
VDCAIAKALSTSLVSNQILFIGAPQGVTQAAIDMAVHKFGRTTGYTVGRITSVDTDVKVGYDLGNLTFTEQIIVEGNSGTSFSNAGDSGSLILERGTNKAVALLFAGSSSHTIANHFDEVLKALGVSLA